MPSTPSCPMAVCSSVNRNSCDSTIAMNNALKPFAFDNVFESVAARQAEPLEANCCGNALCATRVESCPSCTVLTYALCATRDESCPSCTVLTTSKVQPLRHDMYKSPRCSVSHENAKPLRHHNEKSSRLDSVKPLRHYMYNSPRWPVTPVKVKPRTAGENHCSPYVEANRHAYPLEAAYCSATMQNTHLPMSYSTAVKSSRNFIETVPKNLARITEYSTEWPQLGSSKVKEMSFDMHAVSTYADVTSRTLKSKLFIRFSHNLNKHRENCLALRGGGKDKSANSAAENTLSTCLRSTDNVSCHLRDESAWPRLCSNDGNQQCSPASSSFSSVGKPKVSHLGYRTMFPLMRGGGDHQSPTYSTAQIAHNPNGHRINEIPNAHVAADDAIQAVLDSPRRSSKLTIIKPQAPSELSFGDKSSLNENTRLIFDTSDSEKQPISGSELYNNIQRRILEPRRIRTSLDRTIQHDVHKDEPLPELLSNRSDMPPTLDKRVASLNLSSIEKETENLIFSERHLPEHFKAGCSPIRQSQFVPSPAIPLSNNDNDLSRNGNSVPRSLSEFVSYLLHLSALDSSVTVWSPHLFTFPTKVYKCMQKESGHSIVLLPVCFDDQSLGLIACIRFTSGSTFNNCVKVFQPTQSPKKPRLTKELRARLKQIFENHLWFNVRLVMDFGTPGIDSMNDVIYYLMYLAKRITSAAQFNINVIEQSAVTQFKEQFIQQKGNYTAFSCAHLLTCSCSSAKAPCKTSASNGVQPLGPYSSKTVSLLPKSDTLQTETIPALHDGPKLTRGLNEEINFYAELHIGKLETLAPGVWIESETLMAAFMLVRELTRTDYFVIDAHIASQNFLDGNIDAAFANFKTPGYPLSAGALFPVNIANTHWLLAQMDFTKGTTVIYDSSSQYRTSVDPRAIAVVRQAWTKSSNRPLISIVPANNTDVCKQTDGFNCGIYTLFHAINIMLGRPTGDSRFTSSLANEMRKELITFLNSNLHCSDLQGENAYQFPFDTAVFSGIVYPMKLVVCSQRLPLPAQIANIAVGVDAGLRPVQSKESVAERRFSKVTDAQMKPQVSTTTPPYQFSYLSSLTATECGDLISAAINPSVVQNNLIGKVNKKAVPAGTLESNCLLTAQNNEASLHSKRLSQPEKINRCAADSFPQEAGSLRAQLSATVSQNVSFSPLSSLTDEQCNDVVADVTYSPRNPVSQRNLAGKVDKQAVSGVNLTSYSACNANTHKAIDKTEQVPIARRKVSRNTACDVISTDMAEQRDAQISTTHNMSFSPLSSLTDADSSHLIADRVNPPNSNHDVTVKKKSFSDKNPINNTAEILSPVLTSMCSYLLHVTQISTTMSATVFSPHMFHSFRTRYACMERLCSKNKMFAFLPIEFASNRLALVVAERRQRGSTMHTHVTIFQPTIFGSKPRVTQEMREKLKSIFQLHGFTNPRFSIDSTTAVDCVSDISSYLMYIAHVFAAKGKFISKNVPKSEVRKFKDDYEKMKITYTAKSCAHYSSCICKTTKRKKMANMNVHETHDLGPMNVPCAHCGALKFASESRSLCCANGRVNIPESVHSRRSDPLLDPLREELLTNRKLYNVLRPFNNMMACAYNKMSLQEFPANNECPVVLKGDMKVTMCHLLVDKNEAAFAMLYLSSEETVRNSFNNTSAEVNAWKKNVPETLFQYLMATFKEHNVVVKAYKTMYEIVQDETEKSRSENNNQPVEIVMNIKSKRDAPSKTSTDTHAGRLNKPIFENQVAAIYVCRGGILSNEELEKGLRVFNRLHGKDFQVAHFDANLDAMCYPFIHPRGEQDYSRVDGLYNSKSFQIPDNTDVQNQLALSESEGEDEEAPSRAAKRRNTVSRREYLMFRLARRTLREPFHPILGLGRLTAQYIIHGWIRCEADRLESIKLRRTELRSVKKSSVFEYLDQKLAEKHIRLGRLVTLPQSFPGSDLWYRKLYQNSMAVALREGNPDLFITFTGNSNWPEIAANKVHNLDTWITNPLLCVRVFFLKLMQLFDDIVKSQIFGEVLALEYAIEFQKRGMPHAHILITLKNKLKTPEMIDKYISAEIPLMPDKSDPQYNEKLKIRERIVQHMIHSPCVNKTKYVCRLDDPNKCSKGFPKSFAQDTSVSSTGFSVYQRRNDGNTAYVGAKKSITVDNSYVVPHNVYLVNKYNCHINVEACTGLATYKYIFKYIYKGPDRIIMELLYKSDGAELAKRVRTDANGDVTLDLDMTKEYINGRYVSQSEAAWRLCGFPLHGSQHTVRTLFPHLEDQQNIYYRNDQSVPPVDVVTRLMAYFNLMMTEPDSRSLTWVEVDETYRFDTKQKVYVKFKKSHRRVSTLAFISPKFAELYALRCLLVYRAGCTSFEHLRTVNDVLYPTFLEAAQAAGYIVEDKEWDNCLRLLVHHGMPRDIRRLFASLLLYCKVTNAKDLWERYKEHMRNRCRNGNLTPDQLDAISLSHIEWILQLANASLANFGMGHLLPSTPQIDQNDFEDNPPDAADVIAQQVAIALPKLNVKQLTVFNDLKTAASDSTSSRNRLYFLYGKAGCGKTFLTNLFIQECERMRKRVVAVASTGIAATLLIRGRTAHSTFRLPVTQLDKNTRIASEAQSLHALEMRQVDVIVWDEITMQSRFAMEAVDIWLRDIAPPERRHLRFGGAMVLFSGDWAQFLPVVISKTVTNLEEATLDATLKYSPIWRDVHVLTLDQNMRVAPGETDHMEWLRAVGEGRKQLIDGVHIRIPNSMYMDTETDIINRMFTPEVLSDPIKLSRCALLSVKNDDTLALSEIILDKITGPAILLLSTDEPVEENDGVMGLPSESIEYLHTITPSGMPKHKLRVKNGCILMLLRNIDTSNGLCNGTRLELLDVLEMNNTKMLKCRHITGDRRDICFIQRMPLSYSEVENSLTGLAFKRTQFPVRLCFSMTINKSQGQTFDSVGLVMRTPPFAHGCMYVALSRATSKAGIKLTINKPLPSGTDPLVVVRNIVYKRIL